MGCGAPSSRISKSAAVRPGTSAPLASVTTTSTTTCSTLARSVGAAAGVDPGPRAPAPQPRRQQMRGRGAASRVPGSVSCGARRGGKRALASAASRSVRSLAAGRHRCQRQRRLQDRGRLGALAEGGQRLAEAERGKQREPVALRERLGLDGECFAVERHRLLGPPRPVRMSASCRIDDSICGARPRNRGASPPPGGTAPRPRPTGRGTCPGTRRDCGGRTPRRHAAPPRPRGRSGAPLGNGFRLQHSPSGPARRGPGC